MKSNEEYRAIGRAFAQKDIQENPYQEMWEKMDEMKDMEQFDTEQALSKMVSRFEKDGLLPKEESTNKAVFRRRAITFAASIMLGVMAGFMWNGYFKDEMQLANNTQEIMVHEFNDGTSVYLKPKTEISWKQSFNTQDRNVVLKGEAFFKVARNEQIPFKVYAHNAMITVLGTSFNVRILENSDKVEVLVKTGKVTLSSQSNSHTKVALLPHEMGVFNNGDVRKVNQEIGNYMAWLDKKLVFKNASLQEVVGDLNRTYGLGIHLSDSALDSLSITSTYFNMSADELIESICLTLDLSYNKSEKSYILVSK